MTFLSSHLCLWNALYLHWDGSCLNYASLRIIQQHPGWWYVFHRFLMAFVSRAFCHHQLFITSNFIAQQCVKMPAPIGICNIYNWLQRLRYSQFSHSRHTMTQQSLLLQPGILWFHLLFARKWRVQCHRGVGVCTAKEHYVNGIHGSFYENHFLRLIPYICCRVAVQNVSSFFVVV